MFFICGNPFAFEINKSTIDYYSIIIRRFWIIGQSQCLSNRHAYLLNCMWKANGSTVNQKLFFRKSELRACCHGEQGAGGRCLSTKSRRDRRVWGRSHRLHPACMGRSTGHNPPGSVAHLRLSIVRTPRSSQQQFSSAPLPNPCPRISQNQARSLAHGRRALQSCHLAGAACRPPTGNSCALFHLAKHQSPLSIAIFAF